MTPEQAAIRAHDLAATAVRKFADDAEFGDDNADADNELVSTLLRDIAARHHRIATRLRAQE